MLAQGRTPGGAQTHLPLPLNADGTALVTQSLGQTAPAQTDGLGNTKVVEQFAASAEDNNAGVLKTEERYSSTYITGTAAGTVIKSGAGYIDCVTVGAPAATSVVTIYDNTAASGTIIVKLTLAAGLPFSVPIHYAFGTGLTVVVATVGCDLRVGWR